MLWGIGFTQDWKEWNSFMASKRLKILVLKCCPNLRSTPDLSVFTQLKILSLAGCEELEHLHPSIGKLTSLVSLDLSQCGRLKELPEEVGELKDLEELIFDGSGITEIPTSICSLRKLKKLSFYSLWGSGSLREISSSIGDLQNLQHLDLEGSAIEKLPSEIGDLPSLQTLNIAETPISDLPESIRNLSSLQSLQLYYCDKLCSLPKLPLGLTNLVVRCQSPTLPQLSSLIHLKHLCLDHCHLLEDIPELSSRLLTLTIHECDKLILLKLDRLEYLEHFYMRDCNSIERLDLSCLNHLKKLWVVNCNNLVEIQGPDRAKFLEPLDFMGCKSMETWPDLNGCERLQYVRVTNCKKLTQLRGFEKLDIITLIIDYCDLLERTGLL
ncbi:disease resistance protein RPV1-like [Eucalyptus grandis]|uniref:disease resistance protein RPV1-like n=1 Tax=Eucalyptus grandis TaxID=71139 RepID=UPI00192E964D|nr:disease resistance protein RPV1-like [Eucalyptus grandis]XP_039161565.1 disease resistance protein RPV1-like [Eucalyptus grandis]